MSIISFNVGNYEFFWFQPVVECVLDRKNTYGKVFTFYVYLIIFLFQ